MANMQGGSKTWRKLQGLPESRPESPQAKAGGGQRAAPPVQVEPPLRAAEPEPAAPPPMARPEGLQSLPVAVQAKIARIFRGEAVRRQSAVQQPPAVVSGEQRHLCAESGLFGELVSAVSHVDVYLDVTEPFCLVTIGLADKENTVAVALENCMVPFPIPQSSPMVQLMRPMAALVFCCSGARDPAAADATGMASLSTHLQWVLEQAGCAADEPGQLVALPRLTILSSPAVYGAMDPDKSVAGNALALPLLFRWEVLRRNMAQLMALMQIHECEDYEFNSALVSKFSQYRKSGGVPDFAAGLEFRLLLEAPLEQFRVG